MAHRRVIGHEIGHGFDDQDANSARRLLQDCDGAGCRVFAHAPRASSRILRIRGAAGPEGQCANTIGENIGDLGGLNMAHEAYLISSRGNRHQ